MRKVDVLVLAGSAGPPVIAKTEYGEEAPAAPHTFTSNVNVVSDHRFRGPEPTDTRDVNQGTVVVQVGGTF
jgi:hypothetical protein